MAQRLITLGEYNPREHDFYGYTTARRGIKHYYLYAPSTYEEDSFTNYASGKSINLSYEDLQDLAKTNPDAYVHFLVSDGHSTRWIAVRNIRVIII